MKYLITVLFLVVSNVAMASYSVVANKSFGVSSVSKADLKRIFDGSSDKLNAKNVTLSYIESGAASEAFFSEIVQISVPVFVRTWFEKALSGAGTAPVKKSSSQEVIDWVKANTSGVGFIESSAAGAAGDVQILSVN